MRRSFFYALAAGTALTLTACSGGTEETPAAEETAVAEADAAPAASAVNVLDANTATAEELAAADGMTPELADTVVAGRPYASVTALNEALTASVSPEEAATILTGVFVPVNLNTASEEDIKLIPGMTEKMEHEFMEYRPYEDMAEFDREIGKYVDEAEVARFRSYVTL